MNYKLVTQPKSFPLSRGEAKDHLRLETSASDTYVDALVRSATDYCQQRTRRQFIKATYRLNMDDFPFPNDTIIEVPWPPLISVTSITYKDQNGVTQTWSSSKYQVDTDSDPGRIRPVEGEDYPDTQDDTMNAVTINYTAGYGANKEDIPDNLIHAVRLMTAFFHENRQLVNVQFSGDGVKEIPIPAAVDHLLNQYTMRDFVL